jgi:branched-chain amino acid transport system substrate-binding protein
MARQRFLPKAIISPGSSGMFEEEYYQTLGPLADYTIFHLPWPNPKSQMAQVNALTWRICCLNHLREAIASAV